MLLKQLLALALAFSIFSISATSYTNIVLTSEDLPSTKPAKKIVTIKGKNFTPFITKEEYQQRVQDLGATITKDYAGNPPLILGVMKGAFIFCADLMREIKLNCPVEFVKLSSYGDEMKSSGKMQLDGLKTPVTGKDVIIVEDIIDSGKSIMFMHDYLSGQNPKSLRIACLLQKNLIRLPFQVHYVGFNIGPEFVVGLGLDYAQEGRGLDEIYRLDE